VATLSVSTLLKQNERVFFCPQNIAEFWNVATRPVNINGLGFSHAEVLNEIQTIENLLTLPPDSPNIYTEWKRLVRDHRVLGVKVFDARLVAVASAMQVLLLSNLRHLCPELSPSKGFAASLIEELSNFRK
jgi:hypothetical protein